jgi:hypothetical protein
MRNVDDARGIARAGRSSGGMGEPVSEAGEIVTARQIPA